MPSFKLFSKADKDTIEENLGFVNPIGSIMVKVNVVVTYAIMNTTLPEWRVNNNGSFQISHPIHLNMKRFFS